MIRPVMATEGYHNDDLPLSRFGNIGRQNVKRNGTETLLQYLAGGSIRTAINRRSGCKTLARALAESRART